MKKQRAERLRTTVDFLPPETKRAMLAGLERNRIITGANTDRRGGMCPMIAADRNAFEAGPMADIFASVWDSYNGACILNRRDATERDLRVLKTMLETSLVNSPELSSELGQAWLDYHTETASGPADPSVDFSAELTSALKQSAHLDTSSSAQLSASPSPASSTPDPAGQRKIELVYDGGPLPQTATPQVKRSTLPAEPAKVETTAVTMSSTYEPYTIAAPTRRTAPAARRTVEAPAHSLADRHAAQSSATAERVRARAIIANQAATLRGREWPRSARPTPAAAPISAEAPTPELTATPLEAPAIRQASIPQRRSAQPQTGAPASPRDDRTGEPQGDTGWSWLPPFGSYDDHRDAPDGAGELAPEPRAVPEVRPSEDQSRPIRM
jgi:hypothetical protein